MRISPESTKGSQRRFYRSSHQPGTNSPASGDHFTNTGSTALGPSKKRSLHASPIARTNPLPRKLTGYEAHHRLASHLLVPRTPEWTATTIGGKPYNLHLSLDPSRKANQFVIDSEGVLIHPGTVLENFVLIKPSHSDLYDYAISNDHAQTHPLKIVAGEIITSADFVMDDGLAESTQAELAEKTATAIQAHKSYFGLKNQELSWVEQPATKPENGDRFWSELVLVDGSTLGFELENQNSQWSPVSEQGIGKGKKSITVSFTPYADENDRLEGILEASLSPLMDETTRRPIDGFLVITLAAKTSHEIKYVLNMASGLIYPESTRIETLQKIPAEDQFVYDNNDAEATVENTYVSTPVKLEGPPIEAILERETIHQPGLALQKTQPTRSREKDSLATPQQQRIPYNFALNDKFQKASGITNIRFISELIAALEISEAPEAIFTVAGQVVAEVMALKKQNGVTIIYNPALLEEIVLHFHKKLLPNQQSSTSAVTPTTASSDAQQDRGHEDQESPDPEQEAEAFAADVEAEVAAGEKVAGPFGAASDPDEVTPSDDEAPTDGPFGGAAPTAITRYPHFEPTQMGTPFVRHQNDRVIVQYGGTNETGLILYIKDETHGWDVQLNLNFNPRTGLIEWMRPKKYHNGKPYFGAYAQNLELGKFAAQTKEALCAYDNNWIFLPSQDDSTVGLAFQLKISPDPKRPGEYILERSFAETIPPGTLFDGTIQRVNNGRFSREDERMRYGEKTQMTGPEQQAAMWTNRLRYMFDSHRGDLSTVKDMTTNAVANRKAEANARRLAAKKPKKVVKVVAPVKAMPAPVKADPVPVKVAPTPTPIKAAPAVVAPVPAPIIVPTPAAVAEPLFTTAQLALLSSIEMTKKDLIKNLNSFVTNPKYTETDREPFMAQVRKFLDHYKTILQNRTAIITIIHDGVAPARTAPITTATTTLTYLMKPI